MSAVPENTSPYDPRAVEAAALSRQGITQVEASAGYSARAMHLAASNGFAGGYARTSRSLSAVAFTGQGTGMERDWSGESRTYQSDLPAAQGIGELAADRALARAGAVKPKTGTYPVLFDERVASSLIGHLLSAINGTSIARGSSWLRDALGQQVLPKGLSVIEDPHRPRISGSRPFDGEGIPTRRRAIVQDGILTSWTLDLATARKLGMQTTGNAGGSHNLSIRSTRTQASDDFRGLLKKMGTGLLVTELMGQGVNYVTGDYSRGASGYWVENGVIQYPVEEITIAGNLRDMFKDIAAIGNDVLIRGTKQTGSILIGSMTVAGS